jgi:hypothetical protein
VGIVGGLSQVAGEDVDHQWYHEPEKQSIQECQIRADYATIKVFDLKITRSIETTFHTSTQPTQVNRVRLFTCWHV